MRIKRQHKLLFVILMICSISLQAQTKKTFPKSTLIIPPKQVVRIEYPYMKGFTVKLWNKSKFELGVSAREHHTDSLSKGFGLNKGSFATIQVADKHYLQLENRFIAPLKVERVRFLRIHRSALRKRESQAPRVHMRHVRPCYNSVRCTHNFNTNVSPQLSVAHVSMNSTNCSP